MPEFLKILPNKEYLVKVTSYFNLNFALKYTFAILNYNSFMETVLYGNNQT